MWIKIKDHLPAEGQQIIAFSPDNGTDYPVSIGFWVSYENGLCDAPDGVVARKFAFTHWQPIPDAPQDGHITSGLADLTAAVARRVPNYSEALKAIQQLRLTEYVGPSKGLDFLEQFCKGHL